MNQLFSLLSAMPYELGIAALLPSAWGTFLESERRPDIIIIYADDIGYGDPETWNLYED